MRITIASIMCIVLCLVIGIGCSKLPDDRLLERGKQLEEQEQFADAIKDYEKLAKDYPQSPYAPEALYRAGLAYTNNLQLFDAAITTFERVIDEYPDSKSAGPCQFMIGFIYANNTADTTKARIAYNKFLDTYPEHELAASVQWELKYLGMDINQIPELQGLEQSSTEDDSQN